MSEEIVTTQAGGAFMSSLKRNNRQIRDDRAEAIERSAKILYKREIEDMETELSTLEMERNGLLDVGSTSTTQIISLSDFNTKQFVEKDLNLGLKIRELNIKLEIAKGSYNKLFGE